MQLTLHADSPETSRRFTLGARNVCLLGETRRAPSRHYWDAKVYGHATTAMHDMRIALSLTHTKGRYSDKHLSGLILQ